jgi:hypothetical protein
MPTRALIATLLALTLAIAACGDDETVPPPELPPREFGAVQPDTFFGINGQGLRPLAEDGELDRLSAHLDTLAAGGVTWVRANTDWPRIEPEAPQGSGHTYRLDGLDDWVRALAEHGLRWAPAVMGVPTPPWAVDTEAAQLCGLRAYPARDADLAALAGALAKRYGRGGSFWRENPDLDPHPVVEYELWNEPNLGSFWCPVPSPKQFAQLADTTADAILAVDPQAELVLGGLASFHHTDFNRPGDARYASAEFLNRMLAERPALADKIDVVGVHAYGASPRLALESLARQRAAVDSTALRGRPLSYNEYGWFTSGESPVVPAIPDEARAGYLALMTDLATRSNCGLDSIAPHTWITNESDPANLEDWYGIADPATGDAYESGQAYLDEVLRLEGRGPEPPPTGVERIC